MSRDVQLELGFLADPDFYGLDVGDWNFKGASGDRSALFLASFWWIWCWRNNWVFGVDHWSMREVVCKIWISYHKFMTFLLPPPIAASVPHEVKWIFPTEGTNKINSYGSCIHSSH